MLDTSAPPLDVDLAEHTLPEIIRVCFEQDFRRASAARTALPVAEKLALLRQYGHAVSVLRWIMFDSKRLSRTAVYHCHLLSYDQKLQLVEFIFSVKAHMSPRWIERACSVLHL